MKNKLSERLNRVLMQDKLLEPQRVLPALKSDLRDLLREYAELSKDLTLEVQESEDGYDLILIASFNRFKSSGTNF